MKKIVLSIAGVMAAAAFAPEASALPAFARQTGMACNACHQQHFPILNGFGRAFKASGYTMMGSQGKVEAEHLSIPDTLNAAILAKVRYQKTNNANALAGAGVGAPNATNNGQLQFGDEFSLFFGGRVAENIGFLFEGNTVAVGGALMAGFKMPVTFDLGSAKVGLVPFTTDALGVQYGFELSSGGVLRANRWMENRRDSSAIQYNADQNIDAGAATGFSLVAQNDFGFINYTQWAPAFGMGANGAGVPSYDMKNSYIRIAATPTVADWAMVVGAGQMSGTSAPLGGAVGVAGAVPVAPVAGASIDTKQTFVDFQAHGEVAGKELGVYAQYASAPATLNGNSYNANALITAAQAAAGATQSNRTAFTIGADYSVIPHALHIGAAYRTSNTGRVITAGNVRGATNNAVTLTAVYDLTQNVALHLNQTWYSGNDTNRTAAQVAANQAATTSATLLTLEAAW